MVEIPLNRTLILAAAVEAAIAQAHAARAQVPAPPAAAAAPLKRPDLRTSPIAADVERLRHADQRRARKAARQARGMQP